jgi:hypothetical protein
MNVKQPVCNRLRFFSGRIYDEGLAMEIVVF